MTSTLVTPPEVQQGVPAGGGSPGAATGPDPRVGRRIGDLAGAVLLAALAFSSSPGLVAADTKLDLVTGPVGFLQRALQAWDSQAAFGQLQNQAYGYLFPMGPFFAIGDLLAAPWWVVQRLWWSLLMIVAYYGVLRLVRVWGVGGPLSQVVGALAFALAPRVLSTMGTTSVESWPTALAPWVLVPLVVGSRGGSERRAAARSGVAVALAGGVNAIATGAILLLPALYLLTRTRGPRRRRLIGWWLLAVFCATAWWLIPLVVLGRYAYPFLNYIESSLVTTGPTSLLNVLRGTDHWVGFVVADGGPAWTAGFWLANHRLAILATAALAALGVAGLLTRIPERRLLVWSVAVGTLLVGLGYAGAVGSPVAGPVGTVLDAALAPIRNVHKFDVLVRLPLAVGLVALLSWAPAVLERVVRPFWTRPSPRRIRVSARLVLVLLLTVPLLVGSLPAWRGGLAPRGSFLAVPPEWPTVADWLAEHQEEGRALVVPAANFGEYTWGRPLDEPLAGYATSPWAVRNGIPLGAPGATRWMDGVQAVLAEARPSATLAASLASAGITHLVLRNDLDPASGVPPGVVARTTVTTSPGLTKVASFGAIVPPSAYLPPRSDGRVPLPRAVEVYEVAGATGGVRTSDLDGLPVFTGGPEALVVDGLGAQAPVWLADADAARVPASGPLVVTDTLRRRSLNVGAQRGRDYGPTQTADADVRRGRPVADVSPFPEGASTTVVAYDGIESVTASSTAADPFSAGLLGPHARPFSAVDGDPSTAWVSSVDAAPWWEVTFPAREVTSVTVRFPEDQAPGGTVTAITDAGRATAPATQDVVRLALPAGTTDSLRLEFDTRGPGASVAEVTVPGLRAAEYVVPAAGSRSPDAVVTSRTPGSRRACIPAAGTFVCSASLETPGEEVVAFRRRVDVGDAGTFAVATTVSAVPGPDLDTRLDAALGLRASASSTLLDDPVARPGAAVDQDPSTAWIPAPRDLTPVLEVDYGRPIRPTTLAVAVDGGPIDAVRAVVVEADGVRVRVGLRLGRPVPLPDLGAHRRWSFRFLPSESTLGLGLPGIREIRLDDAPPLGDGALRLPCGAGPVVTATPSGGGGTTDIPVAVDTTVDDVLASRPARVRQCRAAVTVGPGTHDLVGQPGSSFRVDGVVLTRMGSPPPGADSSRAATTERAGSQDRTVSVAAGPEALLVLDEGANTGWSASQDGRPLEPARSDGWRQAWVLPASESPAEVEIRFAPARWHQAGLALGALLAVLLVVLAIARPRRRAATAPACAAAPVRRGERSAAAVVVPALLGGAAGLALGALGALVGRSRPVVRRVTAVAAPLLLVAAGVVGLLTGQSYGSGGGAAAEQLLALAALALLIALGLRRSDVGADAAQERALEQVPGRRGDQHRDGDGGDGQRQETA